MSAQQIRGRNVKLTIDGKELAIGDFDFVKTAGVRVVEPIYVTWNGERFHATPVEIEAYQAVARARANSLHNTSVGLDLCNLWQGAAVTVDKALADKDLSDEAHGRLGDLAGFVQLQSVCAMPCADGSCLNNAVIFEQGRPVCARHSRNERRWRTGNSPDLGVPTISGTP